MTISDRDLIATVHNRYGNRTISRFDYTNDEIGRRVARVDSGEAFDQSAFERYAYNDRSELTGSQRFFGIDLADETRPVPDRSFGFAYDSIGNRISSTEEKNGSLVITSYCSNELNQYTRTTNESETVEFEYDEDGNTTFDGRFHYTWNAENRDGFNIIREVENIVPIHNIWGLDLDGTMQGCGGVGGLVSVAKANGLHVAFYDANGNVSAFLAETGFISVHYEYSPYGEPLVLTHSSSVLTHQFSTMPFCTETGLIEFPSRNLSPVLGRWTTRDEYGEAAGVGLFTYVSNSPHNGIDPDGHMELDYSDLWYSSSAPGYQQKVIVHEFGHALGLHHPGGLSNSADAYDADPESLMGRGMTMRPSAFEKAFCNKIKSSDDNCQDWSAL